MPCRLSSHLSFGLFLFCFFFHIYRNATVSAISNTVLKLREKMTVLESQHSYQVLPRPYSQLSGTTKTLFNLFMANLVIGWWAPTGWLMGWGSPLIPCRWNLPLQDFQQATIIHSSSSKTHCLNTFHCCYLQKKKENKTTGSLEDDSKILSPQELLL